MFLSMLFNQEYRIIGFRHRDLTVTQQIRD